MVCDAQDFRVFLSGEVVSPELDPDHLYPGCVGYRNLEDGRVIVLQTMVFGFAIHLGEQNDIGFDFEWSYPTEALGTAMKALHEWDGNDDPPDGWTRAYPPFFRRRVDDGSPQSEVVEP